MLLGRDGRVVFPAGGDRRDVPALEARLATAAHASGAARDGAVAEIATRLNDYATPLPPPDRLRLMIALRGVAPNISIPTQAALDLSLQLLASERPMPVPDVIRKTTVPDVWALSSSDQRVIALYRTGHIEALMHDFLHQVAPEGVVFIAYPPDMPADAEAIAAGPWLPGWQLSYVPLDKTLYATSVRRQRTNYVSVALAGIGVMLIGGLLGGRSMRRHLHLARLKTDLVAAASHELRTPLASMRVLVDGLLADHEIDPAKTREYLAMIAVENARLTRLIDNFLTFSRLERRRQRFDLQPVSPATVITEAVETIRDRLPASCELTVDVDPHLPAVLADREGLVTALINLLDTDDEGTHSPDRRRTGAGARADRLLAGTQIRCDDRDRRPGRS